MKRCSADDVYLVVYVDYEMQQFNVTYTISKSSDLSH